MALLVVLVRPHSPGNLGGAARAAKCFGADLALLAPHARPDDPEAAAFASGAEDVLRGSQSLRSWDDLAPRADVIVGLTSLRGRIARGLPPQATWPSLRADLGAGRRVALVFGPERSGLSTEELRRCDARLRLGTSATFPTLNLSQAVAAALALLAGPKPHRRRAPAKVTACASSEEISRLLRSLRGALASAGYPGAPHADQILAELECSLKRARLTPREVSLWNGALAAFRGTRRGTRRPESRPPSPSR